MTKQVGGITKLIKLVPVVTAGAYADTKSIGGAIKIDGAFRGDVPYSKSGIIHSVQLLFATAIAADLRVYFFASEPTATDFVAFAPTEENLKDLVPISEADGTNAGFVLMEVANVLLINSMNVMALTGLNIPFEVHGGNALYAVIAATGAITPAAIDDIHLTVGILQD